MRFLIVEDELTSQQILSEILEPYGKCDVASNGIDGIKLFEEASKSENPYQLVCMDIMMPGLDGQQALTRIREIEKDNGVRGPKKVRVVMTTALEDQKNVIEAFYKGGASAYMVKPIDKQQFMKEIAKLGVI